MTGVWGDCVPHGTVPHDRSGARKLASAIRSSQGMKMTRRHHAYAQRQIPILGPKNVSYFEGVSANIILKVISR